MGSVGASSMRSTPAGAKNVFGLKLLLLLLLLTCSILFFVFFWGLRGQILGALGSVYIALLVS